MYGAEVELVMGLMKNIRNGSSFCPKVSACLVADLLVIFHAVLSLIFSRVVRYHLQWHCDHPCPQLRVHCIGKVRCLERA